MAVQYCKLLKYLKVAENCWKWPEITENDCKGLKIADTGCTDSKLLKVAGRGRNDQNLPDIAENRWIWLENAGII